MADVPGHARQGLPSIGECAHAHLEARRQGGQYEILGIPEVLQLWQVARVSQVIDILGLMGDSSDNIPGVPGVGEKTAQKLIQQFDSLENLLQHTGQLKGRQQQLVETHAEQARLSKSLATILTDVPLPCALDDFRRQEPDHDQLKTLFQELEFDSLGKRLFGSDFSAGPARAAAPQQPSQPEFQLRLFAEPEAEKTLQDVPHDYRIARTLRERSELIQQLRHSPAVCLDLETDDLDPRRRCRWDWPSA